MQYLQALVVGLIVGAVFTLLRLPLPAPVPLAGILGIVGMWLGYQLVNAFIR